MKKILGIIFLCIFLSNHSQADIVDQLNKLNDLFKAGVISKEEFTKGKSILQYYIITNYLTIQYKKNKNVIQ